MLGTPMDDPIHKILCSFSGRSNVKTG